MIGKIESMYLDIQEEEDEGRDEQKSQGCPYLFFGIKLK